MWILNFLPSFFIHIITLVGVVGILASLVLGMIPLINTYKLPLQVFSLVFLLAGMYLEGAASNEEKWLNMVKEMEAKVALAEEKSKNANSKIEYKFLDKVKVVEKTQVVIQEKLKEVEKVIDAKCEIDPSVISILNEAAKAPK
jgi:hypothetical protein